MNQKNKRSLNFVMIPVLYSLLILFCIFILGAPIIKVCKETVFAAIKQNAPSEIETFSEHTKIPETKNLQYEVEPKLGSKYAILLCERVGLKVEVYYGDSDREFKNGIGQYANGNFPWTKETILLGGHDTTYFSPLEEIMEKDIVSLRTNQKEYQYQVQKIEIVEAELITDEVLSSEDQLILYTCYPFGDILKDRTKRYLVYCTRLF